MVGVYLMTNKLNGKKYVGQSLNMPWRWKSHGFPSNLKPHQVLGRAILKYGIGNFEFTVLEKCTPEELDEREMHYIEQLQPEYNMTIGGRGVVGNILSEEVKALLSAKAKDQWDRMTPEQQRERVSRLGKQKGHPFTEDARSRIRATLKEYFKHNTTSELQRKRSSEVNKVKLQGNQRGNKSVACLDSETGEPLLVFASVKSAAKCANIHPSNITSVLKGRQKTAGGFVWGYYDCSSVETIPQGSRVEISTTRSAEQPGQNPVGDIVQAVAMEKLRVPDQGIIDLAYRTGQYLFIDATAVYEHDDFDYSYGLDRTLRHKPTDGDPGELVGIYAQYEMKNGAKNFKYWPKAKIIAHAKKYSQSWDEKANDFKAKSAWKDSFEGMAKVPVLKDLLKIAPKSIEFQKQIALDGAVKTGFEPDMSEAQGIDVEYTMLEPVNTETGEIPMTETEPQGAAESEQTAEQGESLFGA